MEKGNQRHKSKGKKLEREKRKYEQKNIESETETK